MSNTGGNQGYRFVVEIPDFSQLTEEERADHKRYPVRLLYPSWDDAVAHRQDLDRSREKEGADRRATRRCRTKGPPSERPTPLPDDAVVDQRCAPVPRDLYLRLARARAFPTKRIGKRITARWGDVKAAFADPAEKHYEPERPEESASEPESAEGDAEDGLDDLRRDLGFVEKGT